MNGVTQKSTFSFSLVTTLAWRNLWRNKRRTLITSFSIAISFAFALLVQTLNDGAHASMIANAIKLGNGHIAIQSRGYELNPANFKMLNHHQQLMEQSKSIGFHGSVEPRITLNVLASSAHHSLAASIESGDPESDSRFTLFKGFVIEGKWLEKGNGNQILIGHEMAKKLDVGIGNKVVFMSASETGDTIAHLARVRGIFKANIEEVDKYMVLSSLAFGQKFLREEQGSVVNPVTRLTVILNQPDEAMWVKNQLEALFQAQEIEVMHWEEMIPELLQFIKVDDAGGYIFLGLILIMVVFGVANTLFMSVLERTREFALLHVVGLSKFNLVITMILETFFLSFFALSLGWIIGLGVHYYFATHGLDISKAAENSLQIADTIMDPIVYSKLTSYRAVQFTVVAFVSTMLVGVYPAFRAGRVAPVRALQS